MSAASLQHLRGLYASSEDPWDFRTNPYEIDRLDTITNILRESSHAAILELGCGNGELAHRLVSLTGRYVGVDAVPRAIELARHRVPTAQFEQVYLPSPLPVGPFELVVLSEILYFLDEAGLRSLASELCHSTPDAELLCVNYLGSSGHLLDGGDAFKLFVRLLGRHYLRKPVYPGPGFQIDWLLPVRPKQ